MKDGFLKKWLLLGEISTVRCERRWCTMKWKVNAGKKKIRKMSNGASPIGGVLVQWCLARRKEV